MTAALARLGIDLPIIQAPMAGVSTPTMAAAVSNAGALGSIAVGAGDVAAARAMIAEVRARTDRPFNVNLFAHAPPTADSARAQAWLAALAPAFARFGATPPATLHAPYASFVADDAMLAMVVAAAPPVVSLHFGLPTGERIAALKASGSVLLASVTTLAEGEAAAAAGIDMIVAQGIEAGGHRGMFDPTAADAGLGTLALTRLIAGAIGLPVIAAGGIMDGGGIVAALRNGAIAVQLGTAFIACPESSASAAYRAALFGPGAGRTVMTDRISGRPARCLPNAFTALGETLADVVMPDYPIAYDAGKALDRAARAAGEPGFGAHWAGRGAPHARALPAAQLIARLSAEMALARAAGSAKV